MSLPFAFFVGPLVLPKENSPENVLKARRYMPTKHGKSSLHIIALTGGLATQKFYYPSSFFNPFLPNIAF